VQQQLEGLEEKFRVYNKDDLADALRARLDELAKRSQKWSPEILHLLLELSDKPVANSDLGSLDFLEPTVELVEPRYKWEDLAAEDPLLRDKHVWRNIDYGAGSSDDEGLSLNSDLEASGLTENTTMSSLEIENLARGVNNLTVPADVTTFSRLETAQFWRSKHEDNVVDGIQEDIKTSVVFITELQAIREVLLMLSGLPTSLFIYHQQDVRSSSAADDLAGLRPSRSTLATAKGDMANNLITPAPRYVLKHASSQVFHGMMAQLAQYGNSILILRVWMRSRQSVPLLQSLQSEVMTRIRQFDEMMSNMEARYVEPCEDLVISLVEMHTKVTLMVRPLLQVSEIINVLSSEPYAHAFRFLELLYDRTCESQMIGDGDLYEFLGTMFFDCFQVYLRQIRRWMEEGELWENDHVFFVSENTGDLELASLWLNRYKLRKTSNGTLHAPKFLHPATSKIFTTGKSVVVLKTLKKYDRGNWQTFVEEPTLDFRRVCGSPSMSLAPFPELFDVAFDQWVKSKHHVTSSTLRRCLFDECGLRDSLAALESIYFMVDGATTSQFTNALFEKLDSGKSNWNDRFTLTELAQGTIGCLPCVTAERLKASTSVMNRVDVQRSRKSVKALTTFAFTYSLPWPVQIIIAKDSILSYQRIFSFLLQIRRSAHVLQGIRLGTLQIFLHQYFWECLCLVQGVSRKRSSPYLLSWDYLLSEP
jgi:gamma-tubulin complex component 5